MKSNASRPTSTGVLLCLLAAVPSALAFAPSSASTAGPSFQRHNKIDTTTSCPSRPSTAGAAASTAKTTSTRTSTTTALGYANSPLPSTNDPYVLLGLSTREGSRLNGSGGGAATAHDEKEVKRAFRRMTKLYHPDAVTTKDSTEAERRQANDDFARINAAYQAIVNPEAAEVPKTVQVQKPWYESVTDFTDTVSNGGGGVSDIFERNAQKRKEGRQNPYSGMGGTWVSGARSTGPPPNANAGGGGAKTRRNSSPSAAKNSAKGRSTRPNAGTNGSGRSSSNNSNGNPFGGFTSSAASTMSDIFDRNARKRDEHRRAGTGPYDPNQNQSILEEKLASLMKQAAEADERYNNLKREMLNGDSSLKEQNVALRRDAAGYKARCQSLEEELKTAQVKAAAAAKASAAAANAAAANKNNGGLSSKEKAVLGEKIAALRKEASDAKAKCSAMEEQVAVAQVRCESLEAALKKSKAELEEKKKGGRWGFVGGGSGGDAKDVDDEKEALQAKVDELETSVRNHVDVVQKYKKECDTLKQKAKKDIPDQSTDEASPRRERSSLRQAFRMRVSETAAKSTELIKEPSLKILNKLNRSRKNGKEDANTPIDATSDASTLDSPSPRATVATHGKRIPTGTRAKARMVPNHKYTSKKSSEFASAVGIASSTAKGGVKGEASVVSSSLSSERSGSGVDTIRRVSDRMHEKKALVISGSVALLVVRSLLKAWIKGGML